MGALDLEQGRMEEARLCLDEGVEILRQIGDRVIDAAKSALAEAEQMSEAVGAVPESELGREIAKLRRALSGLPMPEFTGEGRKSVGERA